MKNSIESSSATPPSSKSRSKKPNLPNSKVHSPSPAKFSSQTPEKPPQRTRNRGFALSIAEIRNVAKGLHQDKNQNLETTPSQVKSARRQILLWPDSSGKPKNTHNDSSELPEKYKILGEFFDRLDTLMLMFRSKGKVSTFTKVSSSIESLTERRFTHGHLAQLKFLVPEAIVIKKTLVHDERTSCMQPDLHISLNPNAVANSVPQGGRVSLKKLFQARLREFWESHPEFDEIPEETLPEPFNLNRAKKDIILDMLKTRPPTESANIDENVHLSRPSLMPQSFTARFSKRVKQNGADDVQEQPLGFPVPESSLKESLPFEDTISREKTSPTKLASEAASSESCQTICPMESSGAPLATPSKTIECTENKDESLKSIDDAMSTPVKLVSTPLRLMSATPALRPSKRHHMSPDDNSTSSLNKLARLPPRSRSLKFDTPVKNKEVVNEDNAGGLPIDDDVFDILPENLIQSIREKERMAMEEKDPAISQAKKRKKNIASLPKLFDMIRHLLRQRNCITKAELVSKIITSHYDIVDRNEVEEQLHLLQEQVPQWISEKLISSGDLLFCINKMLSPETIRTSLVEAAK